MSVEPSATFVSTGELPQPELVRLLVTEAHERFAAVDEGEPSQVYPALARVSPRLFGICVVGARGGVFGVGDVDVEFTIMSVAKPFVFARGAVPAGGRLTVRRRHAFRSVSIRTVRPGPHPIALQVNGRVLAGAEVVVAAAPAEEPHSSGAMSP